MPMMITPETDRLHLRQWQDSDYEPFANLNADPQVMEHFPACMDRIASNDQADSICALIAEHGWGFWAVELKQTQEFIGFVGLHTRAADAPFPGQVEIGWRLAAQYWGKGYATEAAQAAVKVAFEQLGLEEIIAITALHNKPSQAVMEKLGMRRDVEGFEHPAVPVGHPARTHVSYRLRKV